MSTSPPTTETDAALMKRQAHAVEAYLAEVVAQRKMPRNLREATEHGVLGGGKRMRPILTLRSCAAVGGEPAQAMPAAAAIELIHCFSLIHDDLPAMDNDEMRRGRPTVWKAYGDAMAILVGDLMSGLAFEVVATRLAPALAGRISLELSLATNDMIAGQVWDTLPDFAKGTPPTGDDPSSQDRRADPLLLPDGGDLRRSGRGPTRRPDAVRRGDRPDVPGRG